MTIFPWPTANVLSRRQQQQQQHPSTIDLTERKETNENLRHDERMDTFPLASLSPSFFFLRIIEEQTRDFLLISPVHCNLTDSLASSWTGSQPLPATICPSLVS